MPDNSERVTASRLSRSCSRITVRRGETSMKHILISVLVLVLAPLSLAKDLPEAPSSSSSANDAILVDSVTQSTPQATVEPHRRLSRTFITLAVISTGSTFADSYTTLFARQNWLAGKTNVCNMEVQSAYLYGTHPTVGRAYAVASAKSAIAIVSARYLRKHHNRFWTAPLVANTIISLQGVGQNLYSCN